MPAYRVKTQFTLISPDNPYFNVNVGQLEIDLPPGVEDELLEIFDGLGICYKNCRYLLRAVTLQHLRHQWERANA